MPKTAGKIKTAFCRLCQRSKSPPTISEERKSPKRWIMKMEMAIALARRFTGTDSRIKVLIGPVGRKSRNIAEARQLIARTVFEVRKATKATGTAVSTE